MAATMATNSQQQAPMQETATAAAAATQYNNKKQKQKRVQALIALCIYVRVMGLPLLRPTLPLPYPQSALCIYVRVWGLHLLRPTLPPPYPQSAPCVLRARVAFRNTCNWACSLPHATDRMMHLRPQAARQHSNGSGGRFCKRIIQQYCRRRICNSDCRLLATI